MKYLVAVTIVIIIGIVGVVSLSSDGKEESTNFDRANDTQIMKALEQTGEIGLISVDTLGIYEVENHTKVFGDRVLPGSKKVALIEYSYESNFGIDASEVRIKPKRGNRFEIRIPEFEFLGYDHVKMETKDTQEGMLSFGTEDIDSAKVIEEIMERGKAEETIDEYRDKLEEATEEFYSDLVWEFTDEIALDFKFE